MKAFRTVVSVLTLIAAILLCPPIFERTLSMGALLDREVIGLWIFCAVLVGAAAYVRSGKYLADALAFVLFNLFVLMSIEFAARATVVVARPAAQDRLANLGNKTYGDLLPYQGHPFLQFTGVPGSMQPGTGGQFNNFGFAHTGEVAFEKADGTLRIATLGGSTTANSYPERLERYMTTNLESSDWVTEVLNFGLPYWTTAHSLVNFVLNVVDFEPDYVVIHHAWNDSKFQKLVEGYRGDYSHILQPFESPNFIADRYLIRISVLYRYVKFRFAPPDWAFLGSAVSKTPPPADATTPDDEFRRYRRNIESMVDVALTRGIRPVLTTMPHTLDATKPAGQTMGRAEQIDEANSVMRDIASSYGDDVLFVDLDDLMTGKMEQVFVDLAHVNEKGRQVKAEAIGAAILQDLATR